MKMKKEYLLLAAITVALVAYLVSRNPNRNLYELPQLAQVTIKDVTKIELASSNGNIILTKEGSDWKISPDKFLADSQKIKEMLTVMENLTLTELISESKNYKRYDLDPAKSIELKIWEKDDLRRQITIGKSANSFNHTFVKLPENEAVYQAKGDFRKKYDIEKGDFRDKLILSVEGKDVSEFEIQTNEIHETFIKKTVAPETETDEKKDANTPIPQIKTEWIDSKGKAADTAKISSFLSMFSNLKCDAFIEKKTKADFSNPAYTFTFKGDKAYTLFLYPESKIENETYYPAISSESEYPFLFAKWQADNFIKKSMELVGQPNDEQ